MASSSDDELTNSLNILKSRFSLGKAEQRGNPAQLVLLAEHAIKVKRLDIAVECIQFYFKLDPPLNQFHCRALFCKAQCTCPSSYHDLEKLNEATGYILKAINVAKKSKIYHFLVFNASVHLWQIVRPYQRSGYRQVIARPLANVVKALEEIGERDYQWRLQLIMSLIHCYLDGGQKEDASRVCNSAISLAKKYCPDRIIEIFKLQLCHHLGDSKQYEKMAKSSDYLLTIYKVYKIKNDVRKQLTSAGHINQSELVDKIKKILDILSGNAPNTQSTLRTTSVSRSTSASSTSQRSMSSDDKASVLVDLCQLAMEHHITNLAAECITNVPYDVQESTLLLEIEYLRCQLMVAPLENNNQEIYSKSAVETRLRAIRRMDDALASAARLHKPETTEAGCVVQWNLCLPLLQHNLRHYISKHLITVAQTMEKIDSLLLKVRCQVHTEVAKCLADEDHLTEAIEHLDKATQLDELGDYQQQLMHYRQRLVLKGQLYSTPTDSLCQAAQIIEQIGGGASMAKHSHALLVKAGMAIAPDSFAEAIGSVSQDSSKSSNSATPYLVTLSDKAKQYVTAKELVNRHKQLVVTERDRERFRLWADLSKVTRRLEVWDIATVASLYCLLYDDGRWEGAEESKMGLVSSGNFSDKSIYSKSSRMSTHKGSNLKLGDSSMQLGVGSKGTPSPSDSDVKASFSELGMQKEIHLLRTMAEVHYIHSECLVHALKADGILLGDKPTLPTTNKIKDRTFDPDTDTDWKLYCDWVQEVTVDSRNGFVRAAELGGKLHEQWLVSNSVVYLWNYSQHILSSPARHFELVESFRSLLATIKTLSIQSEAELVCELCAVLASGLMRPWVPRPNTEMSSMSASPTKGKKGPSGAKKGKTSGNSSQLETDPNGIPHLREALEVCQYAMSIYHEVPLSMRQSIINVWVETKQLLKEVISKNMGHDREDDPCCGECRSLVSAKMISLQGNMLGDFAQCPTVQESFDLASNCKWSDPLLELELWSQLSSLALRQQDYNLVNKCSDKALEFVNIKGSKAALKIKLSSETRGWELLSIAASLKAQQLAATAQGNVGILKESRGYFVTSARFGQKASSYNQVMDACKQYWNTCQTSLTSVAGRAMLLDQSVELLQILATLSSRRTIKADSGDTDNEATDQMSDEDLALRVSMYSLVLQIHTDMQDWQAGLKAVEDAMWVMPRSSHKELAKDKIVFKSKLGKNVEGDMVRFHEEAENFKASLWHLAAINATDTVEELLAYQRAIEMLRSDEHNWQKIEYLITFGEWVYLRQLPHEDAIIQFEHAIDILMNMPPIAVKIKMPEKAQGTSAKSPQAKSGKSPKPPPPPPEEETPTNDQVKDDTGVTAMNNIKQLEYLVRVHVMISVVCSEGSQECLQHLITAFSYVMLIWKNLYTIMACGSDVNSVIPTTVERWACIELSEEMVDELKCETTELSLNSASLAKPLLTMHFLNLLSEGLCCNDLHHLAIPVLSLQLVISKEIINHSATVKLVHMRFLDLCQQLRLISGIKHHETKLAESHLLSPTDVAKSREEISRHQIEQEMILTAGGKKHVIIENWRMHRPRVLSNQPCLRAIWVEQALLLIKQGQYQVAREMLQEAYMSSEAFEDQHNMCVVLNTQAMLSYHEKRPSEMKRLLLAAEKLSAEGRAWLLSCELWYEAFLNTKDQSTARSMLWHAMSVFEELKEERQSEEEFVDYAVAVLKSRLASFKIHQIISSSNKHSKRNRSDIQASCEILEATVSLLLTKGLRREALKVILMHADAMSEITDGDNHKNYLLKAISLYKKALEVCKETSEAVRQLSHTSMLQATSLPVQRTMISVQLKLAELLVGVSLEDLKDQQQQQHSTSRRCIEQLIDDFVQSTPLLTTSEKQWQSVVKMALEDAFVLLISAYHNTANMPELKSQVCFQVGRCLYAIAMYRSPDPELQWHKELMAIQTDNRDLNSLNPLEHYSALSRVMRKESADKAEEKEALTIQYASIACHFLAEGTKLGLENEDIKSVSKAALKVVEYSGYNDVEMTSQYLALYQSCVASTELNQLLNQAQLDASSSQLASLLQQRKMLQHNTDSSVYQANSQLLNDKYEAWRRQSVSPDHLDFIKSFPSNFRIIILQHSPDKSTLYGTMMYPPQPAAATSGKAKNQPVTPAVKTVLVSCSVSASDLKSIQQLIEYYRSDLAQALIRHERSLQLSLHQIKLIGKDKSTSENLQEVTPEMCTCLQEESRLQSYFEDIIASVEAYLQPITDKIKEAIKQEPTTKELDVIILADSDLMEFPFESMDFLTDSRICSVSRDFSLQVLHKRMKAHIAESPSDAGATSEKRKGSEKIVMQPSTITADVSNIKYVIDPSNECQFSAYNEICSKLVDSIMSEMQMFAKNTSKWSGVHAPETPPSYGEWYSLLKKSSGLIFYGTEHFMSYFSPDSLIPLSLVGCSIVILLDRAQNQESFLRQSKQDVQKSPIQLTLEQPTNTAKLLSLVGPSCVVANQCYTHVHKNVDTLKTVLKGCLGEGKSVARALWGQQKEVSPVEEKKEGGSSVAGRSTVDAAADGASEVGNLAETADGSRISTGHTDFRNTVIYGLPHITMIPPVS